MKPSAWVITVLLVLACAAALRAEGAAPTANTSLTFSGPDELQVVGRTFTGVKLVASRYTKVEDASKPTKDNGIDEIFLKDVQTGRLFVVNGGSNGDLPGINDVREGYVGNYHGRMVEVVKVDDEPNTFVEGSREVIESFGKTIKKAFTENLVTSLATGGAGLVVAAIINAGSKATAAAAAGGAAGGAATAATNASTLIASRALLVSLFPALKAVAIGLAAAAVGYSIYSGLKAQFRTRNQSTIQMITAESLEELPDARPPGYLDGLRTGIGVANNSTAPAGNATAPRATAPRTAKERTDDPSYSDLPRR